MSKSAGDIPAETLELFDKLVATIPEVQRRGAKTPYTSLNGHMFALLTQEGTLALRLPADEREAFLKRYKTSLCEQHGTVMKEYVIVPDSLLRKTAEFQKYFAVSFAYVGSLKPKPTKRPAKKPAAKSTASKTKKAAAKKRK